MYTSLSDDTLLNVREIFSLVSLNLEQIYDVVLGLWLHSCYALQLYFACNHQIPHIKTKYQHSITVIKLYICLFLLNIFFYICCDINFFVIYFKTKLFFYLEALSELFNFIQMLFLMSYLNHWRI